jgi:hypothetical protein
MTHPEQLCVNPRFIKDYLEDFFAKCPKLSKQELYLAAWGSDFEDKRKVDNTVFGGIKFRPLFVSAEVMIKEIVMELPPYDARGIHSARWRHACMQSYNPREDTPQKGRNAPAVPGQKQTFTNSQKWHPSEKGT